MNIQAPISTIMSSVLVMVNKDERLQKVKDVMDQNNVHHIPVVREDKLVGMISKTDLLHFLKGMSADLYQEHMNEVRLKNYLAEEIMTEDLECLKSNDTIQTALEYFKKNQYHAIPIVKEDDTIVGIVTTFDIVSMMLEEKTQV